MTTYYEKGAQHLIGELQAEVEQLHAYQEESLRAALAANEELERLRAENALMEKAVEASRKIVPGGRYENGDFNQTLRCDHEAIDELLYARGAIDQARERQG